MNPPSRQSSDRHTLKGFILDCLIEELALRFGSIERQAEPRHIGSGVGVGAPAVKSDGHLLTINGDRLKSRGSESVDHRFGVRLN